jgi:ABC-type multidrug transport system ATPase subunit
MHEAPALTPTPTPPRLPTPQGLDPASRRNLWDVVKSSKGGRGIVLTTHSMEEAETLCDRLGIFVDGQLVCIGNPKEITSRCGGGGVRQGEGCSCTAAGCTAADRVLSKQCPPHALDSHAHLPPHSHPRYGGYLVMTLTVAAGQEAQARAFVERLSPNARLTYSVGGTLKFELPTSDVTLSGVFAAMAAAKADASAERLDVLDWGVANATLEEVFIKFARSIGAKSGE